MILKKKKEILHLTLELVELCQITLLLMVIFSKLTTLRYTFVTIADLQQLIKSQNKSEQVLIIFQEYDSEEWEMRIVAKVTLFQRFYLPLTSLEVTMKLYNWFPHYTLWLEIYGRAIARSDITFN